MATDEEFEKLLFDMGKLFKNQELDEIVYLIAEQKEYIKYQKEKLLQLQHKFHQLTS